MIDRRSFLKGAAALFAAPAIVKAESIMRIQVPRIEVVRVPPQDIQALANEMTAYEVERRIAKRRREALESLGKIRRSGGYNGPEDYTWLRVEADIPGGGEWFDVVRAGGFRPIEKMERCSNQVLERHLRKNLRNASELDKAYQDLLLYGNASVKIIST